ncbi:MAG: hypothetical protein EAZ43_01070 [Betaproteobacteria bacterium]|nr:MAG: hypothetical protein EAZ43_01070 [Betaproteobacteria bacterium]
MSNERETLAAVAARIIVESELTDWSLARRKAIAELGVSAHSSPLPTDDEIIAEIKTYHALYGGEEFAERLLAQRECALEAMIELARFNPVLVGPVAEGWAHAGSEIRIELTPESGKDVEYALMNLGVEFTPEMSRGGQEHYIIEDADWPMRLSVRANGHAPNTKFKVRMTSDQLKQTISSNAL